LSRDIFPDDRELQEVLRNLKLARLGDAYVNFLFSLALTEAKGTPIGIKVSDRVLFEAAKKSGIKSLLPRRMKRGQVANVVEALIVDSWLKKSFSLDEMIQIVSNRLDNLSDAVAQLLDRITQEMRNHSRR
jgi:putative ribosome biogenesis GTPase RsgA